MCGPTVRILEFYHAPLADACREAGLARRVLQICFPPRPPCRAAHEGRRESSEVFLKCCLASGCEDRAISAKSMSIACLCVCAEMSVNTPWSCVFCVRLSTLSATPARSTPLEDERHDEMNMHAKKCVSNLVFSFSLFFVLSLLFALALLKNLLGARLGPSWGPVGGLLGAT